MSNNFKIPFFKSKRDSLAIELTLNAKIAANQANKSRSISDFITNYDILLDCFFKLSKLNGKVSSVKGNLTAERYRLESEFQQHLHDAIDRSGDEIIDEHKNLYRYDVNHTRQRILAFKSDVNKFNQRFDEKNKAFARAKCNFVCHECSMDDLLTQENEFTNITDFDELFEPAVNAVLETAQASVATLQRKLNLGYARAARLLDQMELAGIIGPFEGTKPRKILIAADKWETYMTTMVGHCQNVDNFKDRLDNFEKIDTMAGHEFEHWCAEVLRKNGFVNVSVTRGSGDQGVDVLAQKDCIKYAIQCKCYSSDLGNSSIQEVNAGKVIYHCHVGVVMTNRFFTSGAKQAADATGVLLWDRNKLIELVKNADKS